ncbi:uncharacterized protein TNCV_4581431 [Trichonephila clavipes]|nr:uncharacterized protein TNCV_4581431 [Trichonephila clavipes]
MKLQKRRSGDQYSEQKKSPGRLHTWKNDRKAGGGSTVTSVAAAFGINKSVVSRAWKAFQTTGTAVRKVGGGRPRTTNAGMTDISSCRRKEADGSQQASLLSNSLQQRGYKCHGLLWPDAFTKGPYSPVVLNAASR